MSTDEDQVFLRGAVEAGVLGEATASEVSEAVAKVAGLGGEASARQVAVDRGLVTPEQAEEVLGGRGARGRASGRRSGRVGNYQMLEKLGVGGMGVVYRARQLTMDRDVALKVLPPRLAKDRVFVERFLREARSAARLNHPNIVQGIDVGEAEGLYYFAMELVDGETLDTRLRRVGRLPEAEALRIARQVALALEHARSHDIIHRDVKPDNILLAKSGVAKLADLGLAKGMSDTSVTQSTGPLGTPLYMSPEQARGEATLDTRSDIYSLGVTLYHAVVGAPPFTGPSATAVITKHLFEPPVPPRELVPELSEGLSSLLLRMLAKRRETRYQTPAEVLKDIDRLLAGLRLARATPRRPVGAVRSRRRRRRVSPLLPVFATTAIFVFAAVCWLLYDKLANATESAGAAPAARAPTRGERARAEPGPAVRPDPAAKAQGALASARRWAAARPDDAEGAIHRLRAIVERYPGTEQAAAALREAEALEERLADADRAELESMREQARALAARDRFADAVERLQTLAAEHPQFHGELLREQGLIASAASRAGRARRDAARELAERGDFAGAVARLEEILRFGMPRLSAQARFEIEAVRADWEEARRKARDEADREYLAVRLELMGLLRRRETAAAQGLLERAAGRPELGPVRGELEADARDLALLAGLWAAAEQGARAMRPGERFSVCGIRGTFERFAEGVVTVRASGVLRGKPLRELKAGEVLALAARKMAPNEPGSHVARGLFLLAEGQRGEAERALAAAGRAGADVERCRMVPERWHADGVEAEAAALLDGAERLMDAGRWQELSEELGRFERRFARTDAFPRHEERFRELSLRARLATLTVRDLFHGKCRLAGNGRRVEVSYDFGDAEQLADWTLADGPWLHQGGRLVLRGSAAVLRARFTRDVRATVEMTALVGGPDEWGLALSDASDLQPVYSVGMPNDAGRRAVLRVEKRLVAGGPLPLRPRQRCRVTFGLRARHVSLGAEGKSVFEWDDERRAVPQELCFGVGARGRRAVEVASVRLVGTVAEGWAAEELERLRGRLRRRAELSKVPWRGLLDDGVLAPWEDKRGAWRVGEGGAATAAPGSLVLRDREYGDIEWRLKIKPLRGGSLVRVSLRVARNGECYGLTLGGRPAECCLAFEREGVGRGPEAMARFPERVDWRPDRWYDLRAVAVGSELRVELDGALLCIVRDGRRSRGWLSLDVLRGGAAFKDMAIRALE